MKLSELDDLIAEDLHVDVNDLIRASLETPLLHGKWMKYASDESYKLHVLQQRMAKLRKTKWAFYAGRAHPSMYEKERFKEKLQTKTEIELYVNADELVQRLEREIVQQKILVDRLTETVKMIQFRHINIKNAIEWHKVQNGLI